MCTKVQPTTQGKEGLLLYNKHNFVIMEGIKIFEKLNEIIQILFGKEPSHVPSQS